MAAKQLLFGQDARGRIRRGRRTLDQLSGIGPDPAGTIGEIVASGTWVILEVATARVAQERRPAHGVTAVAVTPPRTGATAPRP